MANYVKATNFAVKDTLSSGDPAKIVKGTEIDTEFNAIAAAIASKPDADSPTLTGTPLAPTAATATNNTQISTTAYVVNRIAQDIVAPLALKANLASPTFTGVPLAPTAASGTNTTQIATTAFVHAERSATVTLTNKTLTAPVISTISNSGTVTIPTGNRTLVAKDTTDILTNKTITLSTNTVSGTKSEFNTAVTDTDFSFINDFTGSNQSLGTSGYQKLPGGLIIQWGTIAIANRSTETDFGNISYPIAFPTAALNVTATVLSTRISSDLDAFAAIRSFGRTSFNPCLASYIVSTGDYGITWIAVGY